MGQFNIDNTQASNLTDVIDDNTIPAMNTDATSGQKEYKWQNTRAAIQWGIFNSISQLKSALLMKSTWTVGKGYTTNSYTSVILDHITGHGKETFEDVLFNMEVIKRIYGDAFAEIIRGKPSNEFPKGKLLNLKILDNASMVIVTDDKGIIIRYEQVNKSKKDVIEYKPEEIFHLQHNKLVDQCHGLSDIDAMEKTILAEYNNFDDVNKVMRRQAKPMIMFKLKTDDTSRISSFISKMDAATQKGENIYIPDDEDTVSYEVVQVNVSSMLLEWKNALSRDFYRAVGIPLVLFGSAGSTESGSKMEYTAHEQVFSKDQRFLEKQIWNQLYLKIKFNAPTSLMENLQTDESKDAQNALTFQPNDVLAGVGR